MEDGGRQHRVGFAGGETFVKVFERAHAAGGDNRDMHTFTDRTC